MRLVTLRTDTGLRLHLVRNDDSLVAVDGIADVGEFLRGGNLALETVTRIAESPASGEPVDLEALHLAPPVVAPSKILCVGANYAAHAAESTVDVPARPLLFAKFPNALVGHGEPVIYPTVTEQLDYEGELAVVVGRRARGVAREEAGAYVGGYTILNDISARDLQLAEPQWIRGKSLDTFAPLGPYFVTADEVPDVAALRIQTRVNGELRQDASCGDMVFTVPDLIAFISEAITLEPGDIIATGTPAGVGFALDPPRYLEPGDVVEVSIAGLGMLRSPIAASA